MLRLCCSTVVRVTKFGTPGGCIVRVETTRVGFALRNQGQSLFFGNFWQDSSVKPRSLRRSDRISIHLSGLSAPSSKATLVCHCSVILMAFQAPKQGTLSTSMFALSGFLKSRPSITSLMNMVRHTSVILMAALMAYVSYALFTSMPKLDS